MSSVRFKAGIIIASTFHLKQHRTPQKCRKMQNKGIYTDISRNTIAIRDKSARNNPECRNRSSGNNQPQRIPRGLYHDITPEQPCGLVKPETVKPYAIQLATLRNDRSSRNRPPNRADRISPNRSRQTGAACHGQHAPDFSRLSGQGIVQPVQCSSIAMQGSAFCGFSALNFAKQKPEQLCPGLISDFRLSALAHNFRHDFSLVRRNSFVTVFTQANHVFRFCRAAKCSGDHVMPFKPFCAAAICAAFFLVMPCK